MKKKRAWENITVGVFTPPTPLHPNAPPFRTKETFPELMLFRQLVCHLRKRAWEDVRDRSRSRPRVFQEDSLRDFPRGIFNKVGLQKRGPNNPT